MLKLLTSILIFTSLLFANEIKFTESKYINAIDTEFSKKGILVFNKKFTKLSYINEKTSYKFLKDHILKIKGDTKEILEYEDTLELTIFYTLINSIYKNDNHKIKEYFDISKEKNLVILNPNDYISSVIDKIEYEKISEKLNFMIIYFTNENRIKIVETK